MTFHSGTPYPYNGTSMGGIRTNLTQEAAVVFSTQIEAMCEGEDVDVSGIRIWFHRYDDATGHSESEYARVHADMCGWDFEADAEHYLIVSEFTLDWLLGGYQDYLHLRKLLPEKIDDPMDAVRACAIHEFTHLMGYEYDGEVADEWRRHEEPFEAEYTRLLEVYL